MEDYEGAENGGNGKMGRRKRAKKRKLTGPVPVERSGSGLASPCRAEGILGELLGISMLIVITLREILFCENPLNAYQLP